MSHNEISASFLLANAFQMRYITKCTRCSLIHNLKHSHLIMKLRLPKILLSAVLLLGSMAPAATLSSDVYEYDDNTLTVSGTVNLSSEILYYEWYTNGNATMDGTGTITTESNPYYDQASIGIQMEDGQTCTIGSGITFSDAGLDVGLGGKYIINATFKNYCWLEIHGSAILDVSKAKFESCTISAYHGITLICPNLEVNNNVCLEAWPELDDKTVTIQGNLVLNGGRKPSSGNYYEIFETNINEFNKYVGGVDFFLWKESGSTPSITITGSLILKADTAVTFWHDDVGGYLIPSSSDALFICGKLENQASLNKLKPYAVMMEITGYGEYEGEMEPIANYTQIKFLSDYEFEARTGEGGLTYIYLVSGSSTAPSGSGSAGGSTPPPAPGLNVSSGQTVEITKKPDSFVNMLGGTADATKAPADILNADIFRGDSGTVQTTSQQLFSLDGSKQVGYSIVGVDGAAGANLSIGEAGGSASSIRLDGKQYDALNTSIGNGTLTISEGTTLGRGDGSSVELKGKGSNATNFGRVAADIELGSGSTFLNQGTIDGIVELSSGAIFTNNATTNGDVIVAAGAEAYGSGSFRGTTLVKDSGLLYVGNSPGYQQHKNLTLADNARLGFYIDGTTPASRGNAGSGTHSFVSISGALTLEGVVNVEIGIGMNLVLSGADSFTLTLMKAENPAQVNAADASFKVVVTEGEQFLEEGSAELTWEEELGELIFSGTVSDAAKAMVTAGDYANTLWASTAALKDFAETATNQFLVGKPGETTAWGAAIGSFINHSGSYGFDYNGGGYAIGVQHAFSEQFRAGMAIGQTFGTYTSDNGLLKSDQTGIMAALTAQYVDTLKKGVSSWGVSGYMACGGVENDARGIFGTNTWEDTVFAVGLRTDYRMQVGKSSSLTLFTGIEYTYGTQEEIRLMPGVELHDGRMQTWSIPVGVTLRTQIDMCCHGILAPELTVAYKGYVSQQAPSVRVNSYKMDGNEPGRHELMINAGANWLLDESWSIGAFYSLEARSNAVNHAGNLSVRYTF